MPSLREAINAALAVCLVLLVPMVAAVQEHDHERPSDEEIARLNAEWDHQYSQWQKSLAATETSPGMVVADLGAGRGGLTRELALRVGARGHVYANDIDPQMLSHLRRLGDDEMLGNVTVIQGEQNDPLLPPGRVEAAFLIKVYHQLENPVHFLSATRDELAHGALLHIVDVALDQDWGRADGSVSDPGRCRADAEAAGFEFVRLEWIEITDWKMYQLVVRKPAEQLSEQSL